MCDHAHKLSPVRCASKVLHFFAESGVIAHSHMRFMPSGSTCSDRIPRVLIFLMKYLASCTAPGSMWVTLCTARAAGAAAVMSKRRTLCRPGRRVHLELKHVLHGTVAADLHRLGILLVLERILHATRGHEDPVCDFDATRLLRGASKSNCHLAIAGRLRSTTCVPRAVVLDAQAVERAGADLRKPHCQHGIVTLGALLEDL